VNFWQQHVLTGKGAGFFSACRKIVPSEGQQQPRQQSGQGDEGGPPPVGTGTSQQAPPPTKQHHPGGKNTTEQRATVSTRRSRFPMPVIIAGSETRVETKTVNLHALATPGKKFFCRAERTAGLPAANRMNCRFR
jgi:hypothetical protein